MLLISDWLRDNQDMLTQAAIDGALTIGEWGRKPAQAAVIKFQQITGTYAGYIISNGMKEPAKRTIRRVLASAIFGREINSFKELSNTECSILVELLNNTQTASMIRLDARHVYDEIMQGRNNRPKVRQSLMARCWGICEAWTNRDLLSIDYRGQPIGETPLLATDMHEIVQRSALPVGQQDVLWHPGNALMLSRWFHQDARCSVHSVGWSEWAMDLLFLIREPEEISDFVNTFERVAKHTEPAIVEMKRRLEENSVSK